MPYGEDLPKRADQLPICPVAKDAGSGNQSRLSAAGNTYICACVPLAGQTCVDIKDNVVDEGFYFTPKGDDPCLSCTCHRGEPEMCVAALCERPQGCQQYRKDPKECCKFMCLDPGEAATPWPSSDEDSQELVVHDTAAVATLT